MVPNDYNPLTLRSSSSPSSGSVSSLLPLCGGGDDDNNVDNAFEKFHSDASCNRAEYNNYKQNQNRRLTHERINRLEGGARNVPNQKTVICPTTATTTNLHTDTGDDSSSIGGFDTMWIVENTSSGPALLAWVDPHSGIEYSAVHSKMLAANDPEAVLLPGQWMALHTHEGHVFHVREFFNRDPGELLLQHRVGLVPVGQGRNDLECPTEDPEPLRDDNPEPLENSSNKRAPEYMRRPPVVDRPCNTIDFGFRNEANCPLHGYWIKPPPPPSSSSKQQQEEEEDNQSSTCEEMFKFHLGLDDQSTILNDFMWQWQSPTKFESTHVGNSFSFRLASDPSVLVDTYTVQPTKITDCPHQGQRNLVKVETTSIVASTGLLEQGEISRLGMNETERNDSWHLHQHGIYPTANVKNSEKIFPEKKNSMAAAAAAAAAPPKFS